MEENREAFSGADNALPEESDKEKTKKTVRKRKPAKTGDTAPEKNTAIRKSSKAEKTDKVAAAEKGIPDEAESVSSISENTEDIANALKDTSSRDETAGRKKKTPAKKHKKTVSAKDEEVPLPNGQNAAKTSVAENEYESENHSADVPDIRKEETPAKENTAEAVKAAVDENAGKTPRPKRSAGRNKVSAGKKKSASYETNGAENKNADDMTSVLLSSAAAENTAASDKTPFAADDGDGKPGPDLVSEIEAAITAEDNLLEVSSSENKSVDRSRRKRGKGAGKASGKSVSAETAAVEATAEKETELKPKEESPFTEESLRTEESGVSSGKQKAYSEKGSGDRSRRKRGKGAGKASEKSVSTETAAVEATAEKETELKPKEESPFTEESLRTEESGVSSGKQKAYSEKGSGDRSRRKRGKGAGKASEKSVSTETAAVEATAEKETELKPKEESPFTEESLRTEESGVSSGKQKAYSEKGSGDRSRRKRGKGAGKASEKSVSTETAAVEATAEKETELKPKEESPFTEESLRTEESGVSSGKQKAYSEKGSGDRSRRKRGKDRKQSGIKNANKISAEQKPDPNKKQENAYVFERKIFVPYELGRENIASVVGYRSSDGKNIEGRYRARRKPKPVPVPEVKKPVIEEEPKFERKEPDKKENKVKTLDEVSGGISQKDVALTKRRVNEVLVGLFANKDEWLRKDLINAAILSYGLSAEQLMDKGSESIATRYKSLTGSVISEMLAQKQMYYVENRLRLTATVDETREQINYRAEIAKLFEKKEAYSRTEILDSLAGDRGDTARSLAGTALRQLEDAGEITRYRGLYKLKKTEKYPATPIGAHFIDTEKLYLQARKGKLRKDVYLYKLKLMYMQAINILGSVFMEVLALQAVKTLYGDSVVREELTAGPNDNGIDGVVEVVEPLGFRQLILIQAKTRQRLTTSVTVKELREFVGVMNGEHATYGVMATNAGVHAEGKKFAAKIPNLTIIDMDRLFDIALKKSMGIVYDESGLPFLDADMFISYSLAVKDK